MSVQTIERRGEMPQTKPLPFAEEVFHEIAETYGTPVYVYNEAGIRMNALHLNEAFSWSPGYINHFAVKAAPTPALLKVIAESGMGFDCSSAGELVMVRRLFEETDAPNHGIFYTSNNTPDEDYQLADDMGAVINIDKLPYLYQVEKALGGQLPSTMAIRYNPGNKFEGNGIIGKPLESKFGDTEEHVLEALKLMKERGVADIALHTMVVSNEKRPESFALTARLLRELAEKALDLHGIELSLINVGGGIGVNYHPDEEPVDVHAIAEAIQSELGPTGIPVVSENGRFVTGPHGYLLTRVTHGIVESHAKYLEVDTSINNMARLATVTAAYHQLDVLGRTEDPTEPLTVVGSLCANTDRMFKDHQLPSTTQPGDLMVIHDAGAHCRANSHNYNFRTRCGEVLVDLAGRHRMIRRHETIEDLHRTTDGYY